MFHSVALAQIHCESENDFFCSDTGHIELTVILGSTYTDTHREVRSLAQPALFHFCKCIRYGRAVAMLDPKPNPDPNPNPYRV